MENALTEKLFGMPAWVWGAIVGVGVAGFTYLHRKQADANSADTNSTMTDVNGDPISSDGLAGAQDSGGADQQYVGTAPLTDYSGAGGGFNYSGPPPAVSADVRLPQSTIKQLQEIAKEQATLKRQQAILNRQRGHRNPPPRRRNPPRQQGGHPPTLHA